MKLSRRQFEVLRNVQAWYFREPSDEAIEELFAYTDRGIKPRLPESWELVQAWIAHYGNPYAWIPGWESGEDKNPPQSPPGVWIYDVYFNRDDYCWPGWAAILTDFMRDNPTKEKWRRCVPAYEVAYKMAAYHHGRLPMGEMLQR